MLQWHSLVVFLSSPLPPIQRTMFGAVYEAIARKVISGGACTAGLPQSICHPGVCACLVLATRRAHGVCEGYSKPASELSAAPRRACQKSLLEQARRAWSWTTQCTVRCRYWKEGCEGQKRKGGEGGRERGQRVQHSPWLDENWKRIRAHLRKTRGSALGQLRNAPWPGVVTRSWSVLCTRRC